MIDRLREWLAQGASIDLMSPTFSVHAFAEVRELIEKAERCRLLLGEEAALAGSLFGGPADIAFRGKLQGRWLAKLVTGSQHVRSERPRDERETGPEHRVPIQVSPQPWLDSSVHSQRDRFEQ